jgi:hypothetical protein
MGAKGSTINRSTQSRYENDRAKATEIERVKKNVETFQQSIMKPTPMSSTEIQRSNPNQMKMLRASLVAQEQLSRGGSALTKPDLIAIVTFLKSIDSKDPPEKIAEYASSLSVNDLIVAIRTIVYDPFKITQVTKATIPIEC